MTGYCGFPVSVLVRLWNSLLDHRQVSADALQELCLRACQPLLASERSWYRAQLYRQVTQAYCLARYPVCAGQYTGPGLVHATGLLLRTPAAPFGEEEEPQPASFTAAPAPAPPPDVLQRGQEWDRRRRARLVALNESTSPSPIMDDRGA